MLKLVVAAVVALAIGFTVRDATVSSGPGPEAAWEARAAEVDTYFTESVASGDAQEKLSETGEQIKDWLLNRVDQTRP